LVNQHGEIILDTLVDHQRQEEGPGLNHFESSTQSPKANKAAENQVQLGFVSSGEKPTPGCGKRRSLSSLDECRIRRFEEKQESKLIKRLNSEKENNSAQIIRDKEKHLIIEISKETLVEQDANRKDQRVRSMESQHGIALELLSGAPSLEEVR